MTPTDLPPLREVIKQHGLAAKKSLGQNFILDLNLTGKIARLAGDFDGRTVVEIGPGPGGLTRAILTEAATDFVAIERDARCLDALAEVQAAWPNILTVHNADALEIDYTTLSDKPLKIVANLPYSVATQLLIGWLTPQEWPPVWESMTLMFQREVAERIVATPGTKAYGRLAVLAQWRSTPRIRMTLPPEVFTPAPKVDSAVVHFTPNTTPYAVTSVRALERVTGAAFGQRRKMLRASLKQLRPDAEAIVSGCGIDPRERAEQVSVEGFCDLANAFAAA